MKFRNDYEDSVGKKALRFDEICEDERLMNSGSSGIRAPEA